MMGKTLSRRALRYAGAVVAVGLATGAGLLIEPLLTHRASLATFFAAVAFAAWWGGFGPAILALGLGFLLAVFVLFPGGGSLAMIPREDLVVLGLYLVVGLLIAFLTESLHRARSRVAEQSKAREIIEQQLRERIEQLAEAEARVRAVVDHVVDGIITINERGIIETFNPAAERIFGYQAGEVVRAKRQNAHARALPRPPRRICLALHRGPARPRSSASAAR